MWHVCGREIELHTKSGACGTSGGGRWNCILRVGHVARLGREIELHTKSGACGTSGGEQNCILRHEGRKPQRRHNRRLPSSVMSFMSAIILKYDRTWAGLIWLMVGNK